MKSSLVTAFALALVALSLQVQSEEISFCIEDKDLSPFIIPPATPQDQASGLLVDIVQQASDQAGMKAVFIAKPWKRCIKMMGMGQTDGILAAIWSKARDNWGVFPKQNGVIDQSRSLWEVVYPLYVHKSSDIQWDGERLTNAEGKVSAPLGYVAEEKLKSLGAYVNKAYQPEIGLDLVSKGGLGGYVVEQTIGDRHVSNLSHPELIKSLPIPFISAHLHAPLSHQFVENHPEFGNKFWDAVKIARNQKMKK